MQYLCMYVTCSSDIQCTNSTCTFPMFCCSVSVSSRRTNGEKFPELEILAEEEGIDVEALKNKVLLIIYFE